jgi:hypothetical protein
MLDEHRHLLSSLADRWRTLEERLKAAEQVVGEVCIPAINELRYTGRRFFEAWSVACVADMTPESKKIFHEHIIMAQQYFNNADHDLTDSLITFFDARKGQILHKYGIDKSSEIYVRFVAWLEKVNDANDIIKSSRGNRHNRMDDYKRLETECLPDLIDQYKQIVRSEELYSARLKKNRYIQIASLIIGGTGWAAGMLCLWAEWDKISLKTQAVFGYIASHL